MPIESTSPLDKSIEKNLSLSELDLLSKLLE